MTTIPPLGQEHWLHVHFQLQSHKGICGRVRCSIQMYGVMQEVTSPVDWARIEKLSIVFLTFLSSICFVPQLTRDTAKLADINKKFRTHITSQWRPAAPGAGQ